MCHAMNRSFISVILGGFGGETAAAGGGSGEQKPAKLGSADDAAFIMKNAQKVIIVPGYGMAGGAGPARAARDGRHPGRRKASR